MDSKSSKIGQLIVNLFEKLGLVHVKRNKKTKISRVSNFTLINLLLIKFGPMKEENTAILVMIVQAICSIFAYLVRYGLVHIIYN